MGSPLSVAIIVKLALDLWCEGGPLLRSFWGRLSGEREAAERWDLWSWARIDFQAAKELRWRLTGDLERRINTERSLRRHLRSSPELDLALRYFKQDAEAAIARLDTMVHYFHGGWEALPNQRLKLTGAYRLRGTLMLVR